jgi:hypothetical protein
MASSLEGASPSKPLDLCFVKSRTSAKCLIFATLCGKMGAMLAGRRRSHSAIGISPRMMLGGSAAFGERAGGGRWLKCLGCRARVFDFRVGRAS